MDKDRKLNSGHVSTINQQENLVLLKLCPFPHLILGGAT